MSRPHPLSLQRDLQPFSLTQNRHRLPGLQYQEDRYPQLFQKVREHLDFLSTNLFQVEASRPVSEIVWLF